jgi:hypothetical protein
MGVTTPQSGEFHPQSIGKTCFPESLGARQNRLPTIAENKSPIKYQIAYQFDLYWVKRRFVTSLRLLGVSGICKIRLYPKTGNNKVALGYIEHA